jgi:alpha-amylase
MSLFCAALVSLSLIVGLSSAHTAEEWRSSRAIYQIVTDRFARSDNSSQPCSDIHTYCGGSFQGIKNHLDYIIGMGFNAIWISPIVENVPNSFHGYGAKNLYKINPYFGGEDGLIELIKYCHQRDVWVMVDVVANHVGIQDIKGVVPFNQTWNYHDCKGCPQDCNMRVYDGSYETEHCRLSGLLDLDQDNPIVRSTLLNWISDLVKKYEIDGLRIDTVPQVKRQFWAEFQKSAGVYAVGEVFTDSTDLVKSYQAPYGGLDGLLSYPLYKAVISCFAQGEDFKLLNDVLVNYTSFVNPYYLGAFFDNHDNPRFLSINADVNVLSNALVFTLMAEGIPILYYGTEQGYNGTSDPYDREPLWTSEFKTDSFLYNFISTLVHFHRNQGIGSLNMEVIWSSSNVFAYKRGEVLILTTNSYDHQKISLTELNFASNAQLVNLFDANDRVITDSQGNVQVILENCQPKIYYVQSEQL